MKPRASPLHFVQPALPGEGPEGLVPYSEKLPIPPEMFWVLDAINGVSRFPGLLRASSRLRRILQGLTEADKIVAELSLNLAGLKEAAHKKKLADPHLAHLSRRCEERLNDVNRALDRYVSSPHFIVRDNCKLDDTRDWKTRAEIGDEHFAVEMILEAFRKGYLSRYRECAQCRSWFYALTNHQRFCKDSCRKRYASKSDEYRGKRRAYMRRYRKDQKAMDEKSKRRVKR